MMAGPGAKPLAGAHRSYLNGETAVIPITGPIFPRANLMTENSGATSISMLQNDLGVAMASKEARSIMLLIDSPGGAVSGIGEFGQQVAASVRRKPLVAHISGTGASAAYWIASQASSISADRVAAQRCRMGRWHGSCATHLVPIGLKVPKKHKPKSSLAQ